MKPNECVRKILVKEISAAQNDAVSTKEVTVQCPYFDSCPKIFYSGNIEAGHCEQYEPTMCESCGNELKDKDTFPLCSGCDEIAVDGLIESYLEDAK